jgi:uncharacterized protein YbaP (TraB family)
MPVYNVISPLLYDTPTKTFSIQVANGSQGGYLSASDWINFDGKQDAIILTTTGTSGAATFASNTLNIPVYSPDLSGYVPTSRTLTINGTTYDLSANRSWTIPAGVADVTATSPLSSSGGANPDISIQVANSSQSGYLTNTDWNTFNAKQGALTLTTTGTSGPSTLVGTTLNIPQYQSVLTNPITGSGTLNYVPKFDTTSSIANSNIQDSGTLITLGSNSYVNGNLGIGTSSLTGRNLLVSANITGSTLSVGVTSNGAVQSDVTNARAFSTGISVADSSTITGLYHYAASQGTFGAGATVATQWGFYAINTLTGATNNYGFYGDIASGTGRWNIYMSGTANNYLAGSLGIGATSLTGFNLLIQKDITGATSSFGIHQTCVVRSVVTSAAYVNSTNIQVENVAFTLPILVHYRAAQNTFGASATVTNQYGFSAESTLTGATNNYGFFGGIASGTGRWNLYMNGTANNYLAGSLGIGTTSLTGYNLRVSKIITGATTAYGIASDGVIQSDATSSARLFYSNASTAAASFTVAGLNHFLASQGTFGAGSTVTNQYGYWADANLTGATNNYGFYGNIASARNRWNLNMNGTAQNYLAGASVIGSGLSNVGGSGSILTTTLTNGGSGYVDGTYTQIFATGIIATGNRNLFTIVVSGGIVTSATLTWGGFGYTVGDTLTVTNTLIGGSGSGLIITVNTVDSETLRVQGVNNTTRLNLFNANQAVSTGDEIAAIRFSGADSSTASSGTQAYIQAISTGFAGGADLIFGLKTTTLFNAASEKMRMIGNTGALLIGSNTQVSATTKLEVTGQGYFSDSVGIGSTSLTGYALRISENITGATTAYGVSVDGTVQSDVTTSPYGYNSTLSTAAASFAINTLYHYRAQQGTIGAGSSITLQIGYDVANTLTGATQNIAFRSLLNAGSNVWNLYMSGTASNYLAGSLGIGNTSVTSFNLRVDKNVTGGVTSYGGYFGGNVQSDVTTQMFGVMSSYGTQATTFTLPNLYNFYVIQGTFGAGSTVTNQYGYFVSSSLTGATNNYGFRGEIASGTNRWNIYMGGTADNYLAGSLGIGSTSLTGHNLRVSKTITGATTAYAIRQDGAVQSNVTSEGFGIYNLLSTQAAAFTLPSYYHFTSADTTLGAGSAVTNQLGFYATNLTGATNNYGFYGSLIASTNKWNIYMAGTAQNYLAGNLGIGTAVAGGKLEVVSSGGSQLIIGYGGNPDNYYDANNHFFRSASGANNRMFINGSNGNVGINTTSPDSTAILHIDSTTKGVLFPRMTTTQKNAISSPATGLVVFDTTLGKLCVFSTTWQTITSV